MRPTSLPSSPRSRPTRERARAGRDFAEADKLRDEIARHGYVVRDTPQGPELVPRDAAT